jgi:hypothetical protein
VIAKESPSLAAASGHTSESDPEEAKVAFAEREISHEIHDVLDDEKKEELFSDT